jgi:hypothetical protein
MSSVTFVSKTPSDREGYYVYVYKCTCEKGTDSPTDPLNFEEMDDDRAYYYAINVCRILCREDRAAGAHG